MKRRILTTALAAMSAMALVAAPASAHVNDAKAANVAEQANERQGGTPFGGFIGPVEEFVGSEIYVRAHSGMECGALKSPKITALGAQGIGFDTRFVCPANK
jgi:hypothetical protein